MPTIPDSDQSRPRRDLISKGVPNLGSSKRQFPLVEFQKSLEIQENSLSSFWSQISIKLNNSVSYKYKLFSNKNSLLQVKYHICPPHSKAMLEAYIRSFKRKPTLPQNHGVDQELGMATMPSEPSFFL